MSYLFSYGSNHPEQIQKRIGHDVVTEAAYVLDYGRAFRGMSRTWGGGTATLIPMPGAKTYGLIAEVTPKELELMDAYEGVPTVYKRSKIEVRNVDGRPLKAWVYLSQKTDFHAPTKAYLDAIVKTISTHWSSSTGRPIRASDIPIR